MKTEILTKEIRNKKKYNSLSATHNTQMIRPVFAVRLNLYQRTREISTKKKHWNNLITSSSTKIILFRRQIDSNSKSNKIEKIFN